MISVEPVVCPGCNKGIPTQVRQGTLYKCPYCDTTFVWAIQQRGFVISKGENRLCPNCGTDNSTEHKVCRNCGERLIKICPTCKDEFYIGDNFCHNGHNYPAEIPSPKGTFPWIIVIVVIFAIFCFCVGAIGLIIAFGPDILNELGIYVLVPALAPLI